MKLELEKRRAIAQGCKRNFAFSGAIPGESMRFELGDEFIVPVHFEVFEECVGEHYNQFIFVETQKGEVKKLYPSQLSRRVRAYNLDGIPLDMIVANGSASELYKMHGSVQEGMNALRGRTIKVSEVLLINTLNSGGNFVHRVVYTFDIVS